MSPTSSAPRSFRSDISRVLKYAPAELIGRDDELKLLNDAWEKVVHNKSNRAHVLTFVALGGEGKTSLVAKWLAALAYQDWPGCDAAFTWSFYNQSAREQHDSSSDLFLKEALKFFGDQTTAESSQSLLEKGRKLAQLIGKQRALLVLDGLELLQYPPTSVTAGNLKDQGIATLLRGLAADSKGLCIVTSRYSIPDLQAFWQTNAPEVKLLRLSREAGVALLQSFGVTGSLRRTIPFNNGKDLLNEFEKLVEDVKGHALTLSLFGRYLAKAHQGDIRRRDRVDLEKADARIQGGSAFKVLAAYEEWLGDGGQEGVQALAVLRLLGLFDRPARPDCIAELRQAPAIENLTEPLIDLSEDDWHIMLNDLERAGLITLFAYEPKRLMGYSEPLVQMAMLIGLGQPEEFQPPNKRSFEDGNVIDVHTILRDYFSQRLRADRKAWQEGHERLYTYLKTAAPFWPEGLDGLEPLYQAVIHGCEAGFHRDALLEVYNKRIFRGEKQYSYAELGAYGLELALISCFFEQLWTHPVSTLSTEERVFVFNQAGANLAALGRLKEAIEPIQAAVNGALTLEDPKQACVYAANLTELQIAVGNISAALRDGQQAVEIADSSDWSLAQAVNRPGRAYALFCAGNTEEALSVFCEAENIRAKNRPDQPLLASIGGFHYCQLLLAEAERIAWQIRLSPNFLISREQCARLANRCREVLERAEKTLVFISEAKFLLGIALDYLSLGNAALFNALIEAHESNGVPNYVKAHEYLSSATDSLQRSGTMDVIPSGLLAFAWLRFLEDDIDGARANLDEAWEIARLGPMPLQMADIHLYRARLFGGMNDSERNYPWDKNSDGSPRGPKDDLVAAKKLIDQCGYWRRKEELEDAEEAAKNW